MSVSRRLVPDDPTRRSLTLLWVAYTGAYVVFFYVFQDANEIADASLDGYLEVVLLGIPPLVMMGGATWLRESDVDPDLRPRLLGWTVGTALLFVVAMHTATFVIETRFDHGERWLILLMSTGFGAGAGTVMGVLELRSKQRERERNRSRRLARRQERKRSQLEQLNQYLRHEVLNEVNKINGYADLLAERTPETDERVRHVEVIRRSGREIAAFVGSIRTILDATDHDPELGRVDLVALIRREIDQLERAHPGLSVTVTGPETADVLAGDLLGRVFRNLVENAVSHNEDPVAVEVDVSAGEEWVTATLRDDGSGMSPDARATAFEPPESGDHGYGLYLTRNLVEVYGGRLDLVETGPEGTAFRVRLPAAPAQAAATAAPSAA